ncbi:MAG: FkbM family methyltransferase [Phycisphaerales bacterium]|nr:FkbM family methyltransferase [Phycisphaerales bacterium]
MRRLRFEGTRQRLRTGAGFWLWLDPNDLVGRHVYYTGRALSHDVVEVLQRFMKPGDRILDIGANVGYVSCALLKHDETCRVVSVEPQPAVFELLRENLRCFGDRGEAVQAAISDHSGVGVLELSNNSGRSHLVARDESTQSARTVQVSLFTAPQLLERIGLRTVNLIKIDVEGHEEAVLRSLAPVLSVHRPRAVVFEHYGDPTTAGSPIKKIFDSIDYRILAVRRGLFRWRLMDAAAVLRSGRRVRDFVGVPNQQ